MLINDSTRSVILVGGEGLEVATEKNYNQMHEADGRMKRTSR